MYSLYEEKITRIFHFFIYSLFNGIVALLILFTGDYKEMLLTPYLKNHLTYEADTYLMYRTLTLYKIVD